MRISRGPAPGGPGRRAPGPRKIAVDGSYSRTILAAANRDTGPGQGPEEAAMADQISTVSDKEVFAKTMQELADHNNIVVCPECMASGDELVHPTGNKV